LDVGELNCRESPDLRLWQIICRAYHWRWSGIDILVTWGSGIDVDVDVDVDVGMAYEMFAVDSEAALDSRVRGR
jgi:hypothetical protein